jgi:hypothetical protein
MARLPALGFLKRERKRRTEGRAAKQKSRPKAALCFAISSSIPRQFAFPQCVVARRIRQAPLRAKCVEAISSTLSALPILGPDLFGEGASRKNRIQNYCEQDYPTSCRHDREDQAASPRHRAFRPNTIGRGRCPVTQQRPLIARYSWPPMMRRRPNRATATTLGVRAAAATKLAR